MAPFWGAPTDQLRETGTLFSTHALNLEELFIALDGIVLNRSHWSGPDADSFRTHYSATVRPSVDALQTDGLMSSNALGYWDNRGDERSGRRGEGRENTPRKDGDESYDPDEENPNAQYETPTAAEHLDHFLDNTGEDYDADVDDLIADQPAFAQTARYEVDTQVNFRDRYNWDGGKSIQIGPFTVTDESLAALHRASIAREYNLLGESSSQHTEGSVP